MRRRTFVCGGLSLALPTGLVRTGLAKAVEQSAFDLAADVLAEAVSQGQVTAASLYFRHRDREWSQGFGAADSADAIFLLASISKPISIAALMTLYDEQQFKLDDPVQKFLPEFSAGDRGRITIQQLMTHTSGLPDQLPENDQLRRRHQPMARFVEHAIRTPLLFAPGTRYSYSSMGILLAAEIAQRITGLRFADFVEKVTYQPLNMTRSAMGLGRFQLSDVMQCQVARAAPESGGGDSSASSWDWNSAYWRNFGAPWGGAHGSAVDVARFMSEFMNPTGAMLRADTARKMRLNHNPPGFTPRGLGFGLAPGIGSDGCSEETFGHTGSTGTLAWADPRHDAVCVVLTTLPARAADPHPREIVSARLARALSRG